MSQDTGFRKILPWVLFLSLMFFVNYTGRSIIGPLLVYIEQELNLDHSQATGLLMYLSLGFSSCLVFAGFIPSKIKPRIVIGLSCGGMGIMLMLIARSTGLSNLKILLTCCGLFAGAYFTSAISAMSSVAESNNWSKAISVHELGPAVSFILAPLIAEFGIKFTGSWRGALFAWGCISLVMAIIWLVFVREGGQKSDPPSLQGVKTLIKNPILWFFGWCFAFGITGEFAPYNVLSLHLTFDRGLNADDANHLLSITRLACPLAVILGGFVAPKLGTLKTLRLFFFVHGCCLILMGMPIFAIALPAIFVQAVILSFAWPAILSILPENFPARIHPTILSMIMPLAAYIGTGVAPKLLGIIGHYFSFSLGFIIIGCVSLITIPFCSILKKN